MSARALINGTRIVEVPMAYAERMGDSKLKVFRDGVRFLKTIMAGILIYRPDRLFMFGFLACLAVVALMNVYPLEFYWHHGAVEEWMIYRFLASFFFASLGFVLLSAIALSHEMAHFGPTRRSTDSFWSAAIARLFHDRVMIAFVGLAGAVSLMLLWPGIVEYLSSGTCHLHWSRMVVATFLLLVSCHTLVTAVLIQLVRLWSSMRRDAAATRWRRRLGPRGRSCRGHQPGGLISAFRQSIDIDYPRPVVDGQYEKPGGRGHESIDRLHRGRGLLLPAPAKIDSGAALLELLHHARCRVGQRRAEIIGHAAGSIGNEQPIVPVVGGEGLGWDTDGT